MAQYHRVIDFKCRLCHAEGKDSELMIGMTSEGLIMTCKRHDKRVGLLDLREYIQAMVQCMREDQEIPAVMLEMPKEQS